MLVIRVGGRSAQRVLKKKEKVSGSGVHNAKAEECTIGGRNIKIKIGGARLPRKIVTAVAIAAMQS